MMCSYPGKFWTPAHFGVPQHRERLFLLGTKRNRIAPKYPAPLSQPADGRRRLKSELERGPTAEEAIGDLPNADDFDVGPTRPIQLRVHRSRDRGCTQRSCAV